MDVEEIAPHLWHPVRPNPDWKPSNRGKDGLGWDQTVSSYALVADDSFVLIDPQVPSDESQAARIWDASRPTARPQFHRHLRPLSRTERRGHRRPLRRQLDLGAGGRRRDQRQSRSQSDLRHRRRAARRHPGVRRRDARRARAVPAVAQGSRGSATPSSTASAFFPKAGLEKGITRQDVAMLSACCWTRTSSEVLTHGGLVSDRPRSSSSARSRPREPRS